MKLASALLVLAILGAAAAQWTGKWSDTRRFGRTQYFCVDDNNQFFGVYSELGLMIGSVSSNTVTGVWYEPGDYPCNNGTFTLQLGDNQVSFSSSFACFENPAQVSYGVEQRLDPTQPTDVQCGRLTTSGNFTGHWYQDNIDLDACAYNKTNTYEASYDYEKDGIVRSGYDRGSAFQRFRVYQGVTKDLVEDTVLSLWYMTSANNIVHLKWCADANNMPVASDFETSCHSVEILVRSSDTGSCSRYQYLNPPQSANAGTWLAAPAVAIAMTAAAAVALFF